MIHVHIFASRGEHFLVLDRKAWLEKRYWKLESLKTENTAKNAKNTFFAIYPRS